MYCINPDLRADACVSRYCAGTFLWDPRHGSEQQFVEYLASLASRLKSRPVLIPVGDVQNSLVDTFRGTLEASFLLPKPAPGTTSQLFRKNELRDLCARVGVPTPLSMVPSSLEDAIAGTASWHYPLVIKGIDPDRLMRDTGVRLYVVTTQAELQKIYQSFPQASADNLIIQEFIPNTKQERWIVAAYFDEQSQLRFALAGNKIRQDPITGGVTTLAITADCPTVIQHLTTLIQATGFHGAVDADFCYDRRDGQHKVLDVNPRLGANFRALTDRNGLDAARTMYLDLTRQHIPPTQPSWGRKWMVEDKDYWATKEEGHPGLFAWLHSIRSMDELAHISREDIRPSLQFLKRWALGTLRKSMLS